MIIAILFYTRRILSYSLDAGLDVSRRGVDMQLVA